MTNHTMYSRSFLFLFTLLVGASRPGQAQYVAPVQASGFSALTSYDSLQAFLQRIGSVPGVKAERIALTRQGRRVSVVKISSSPVFGSDTSKLRILLFAQQHGDEPSGKEALTALAAKLASGELGEILAGVDILIVPQMNPDGAELRQRRTSDSLDLNRNHVLLTSPETRGLHDLFYRWMPHVTLDIHEFDSFSSSWSDSGFIKIDDVQLGMLTNLNTPPAVRTLQHEQIFPFISERMNARGFHFDEYIVGSPGERLRHSTTEINDGRQSFGILGTVSFIQEGRRRITLEDSLQRRVLSQLASVEALLEYCSMHAQEIRRIVGDERARLRTLRDKPVAIRMDHYPDHGEMYIPVRMLKTGHDTLWRVHPYHGEVKLLMSVRLPEEYLIEKQDSSIIPLLQRHHIIIDTLKKALNVHASSYLVDSVGQTVLEEDTLPIVSASRREASITLREGGFIIQTCQLQSLLMAIILEPQSIWGLTKYEEFSYLLREKHYPVFRLP